MVERRSRGRYAMHDLVRYYATTIAADLPDEVRETSLVRVMDFHLRTAHAAAASCTSTTDSCTWTSPCPA